MDDLNCPALDVFECFRFSLREVRMPYRAGVLHDGSDDRLVIVCQVFYWSTCMLQLLQKPYSSCRFRRDCWHVIFTFQVGTDDDVTTPSSLYVDTRSTAVDEIMSVFIFVPHEPIIISLVFCVQKCGQEDQGMKTSREQHCSAHCEKLQRSRWLRRRQAKFPDRIAIKIYTWVGISGFTTHADV